MAILEPWGRAALDYCRGILDLADRATTMRAIPRLEAAAASFAALGAAVGPRQALLALGMTHRRAGQRSKAAEVLEQAAVDLRTRSGPSRRGSRRRTSSGGLDRGRRSDDRLTDAERRVAALAAEGRTNREIAAALFTGTTTVEAHLTRIYSKLGIRSRTELARRVSDGSLALDGEPPGAAVQRQAGLRVTSTTRSTVRPAAAHR